MRKVRVKRVGEICRDGVLLHTVVHLLTSGTKADGSRDDGVEGMEFEGFP